MFYLDSSVFCRRYWAILVLFTCWFYYWKFPRTEDLETSSADWEMEFIDILNYLSQNIYWARTWEFLFKENGKVEADVNILYSVSLIHLLTFF